MYHPTTRLLTILELLQAHPLLSGDELARRLEVEPRSVRRYITMLQDLGMPIEAVRGPGGGYRLRPGFKLPPLMFTEDEATALVLGLLGTVRLEIEQSALAVEGALAKVLRVLPLRARARLSALTKNLVLSTDVEQPRPDAALVIELSEAIQLCRRVAIEYRALSGGDSRRTVEPYGVVGWWGHWYLVAYCCLRQDYRTFRLDRVRHLALVEETFMRVPTFDVQVFVNEQLGKVAAQQRIVVEFQASLAAVSQRIPAGYGTLSEGSSGVRFEAQYGDMAEVARFLVTRALPFRAHEPPELREELLRIAERAGQAALGDQAE